MVKSNVTTPIAVRRFVGNFVNGPLEIMFIYREQPGRVRVYNYTDFIDFYLFYWEQPGRVIDTVSIYFTDSSNLLCQGASF